MDRPGTCLKCGGKRLAVAREGLQEMLEKWVSSDDQKEQDRMMKNADLVANRGVEAIMCLMGRGIGEATANRLLVKVPPGDSEGLLQAIHKAEVNTLELAAFGAEGPLLQPRKVHASVQSVETAIGHHLPSNTVGSNVHRLAGGLVVGAARWESRVVGHRRWLSGVAVVLWPWQVEPEALIAGC